MPKSPRGEKHPADVIGNAGIESRLWSLEDRVVGKTDER
jgi:hypothetical protein